MRILHVAALLQSSAGIVQQMSWERQAAKELGIDWNPKIFIPSEAVHVDCISVPYRGGLGLSSKHLISRLLARMKFRRAYFRWLRSVASGYDLVLLRHNVYSFSQVLFLWSCGRKTITVHHTLEIPELLQGPKFFRREMYAFMERLLGRCSITLAGGVLGVTPEILEYEQSRGFRRKNISLVYPNGILYGSMHQGPNADVRRGDVPELLFVASSFAVWQGLDLLLAEIHRSSQKFVLHLVGQVIADADMEMIQSDPRVVLHGRLDKAEISSLASRCHLGLASLALERVGMQEACTLKVREYLCNGLPVYSSHGDVFPGSFPYYKRGAVNIDQIISYAQEMSTVSNQEIAAEAERYISKKKLLADLYGVLSSYPFQNVK